MTDKRHFFVGLLFAAWAGLLNPVSSLGQAEASGKAQSSGPSGIVQPATVESPRLREPPAERNGTFQKLGGIEFHRGDDFRLTCDVYVPDGKGPFPAILAIHGGAWRSGSKLHLLRHAWRLAEQEYVVVAINYRHAPKHKFPAQIHDCKIAVRWLKKHAQQYKIDPQRVGVFGYSAGGHLAALLGTTTAADGLDGEVPPELEPFDTSVQAIVLGGAPCEFSWVAENSGILAYLIGGTRAEKPEAYLSASPTHYVDRTDVPVRIFHGTSDLLVPTSSPQKFHDALVASQVSCEIELLESGHLATFSDFECFDRAISFFDQHLRSPTKRED